MGNCDPPEDVKVLESVESQAVVSQDSLQSSSNSDESLNESGSATPTTLVAQGR